MTDHQRVGDDKANYPAIPGIAWNPSLDSLDLQEEIHWFQNQSVPQYFVPDEIRSWMTESNVGDICDNNALFCNPQIIGYKSRAQDKLKSLLNEDMVEDSTKRAFPVEMVQTIFSSRTAVELANLDFLLDWQLSQPQNLEKRKATGEPMYFADLSLDFTQLAQYLLWKREWNTKGITLEGKVLTVNDEANVKRASNRVLNPEILTSIGITKLARVVRNSTRGTGVHVAFADSSHPLGSIQLQKRLLVCQVLAAVLSVQSQGHFVMKVQETTSYFTVGLLFLIQKMFHSMGIIKPLASNPIRDNVYVVFKWRRPFVGDIGIYLCQVLDQLDKINANVKAIVPFLDILQDEPFTRYVIGMNNMIEERKVNAYAKLVHFYNNPNLEEGRAMLLPNWCQFSWRLDLLKKHSICSWQKGWLFVNQVKFVLTKRVRSARGTFIVMDGAGGLYQWRALEKKWKSRQDILATLPKNTVLVGQFLLQVQGQYHFKLSDALIIGGRDVTDLSYEERLVNASILEKTIPVKTNGFCISVPLSLPLKLSY